MKKEHYRHRLPHFHTPGQIYFVTWALNDSIPRHALSNYSQQIEILERKIDQARENKSENSIITAFRKEYCQLRWKYLKSLNQLLDAEKHPEVNLSKPAHTKLIKESLLHWEKEKLSNIAFSIMPNHLHWVVKINKTDTAENLVYLQDILYSVKRYTASRINKPENRSGRLWQKESFDTTIRDENYLHKAIIYTLNNPVKAKLCDHWQNRPGNWCSDEFRGVADRNPPLLEQTN